MYHNSIIVSFNVVTQRHPRYAIENHSKLIISCGAVIRFQIKLKFSMLINFVSTERRAITSYAFEKSFVILNHPLAT